jgi:hypothetical protein
MTKQIDAFHDFANAPKNPQKVTNKRASVQQFSRTAHVTPKCGLYALITMVNINFLPGKRWVDPYRFDADEAKYSTEITQSPTTFGRRAFKFKNQIFGKIYNK